ncbi:hypothetical protein [Maribacter ulvicola]|uniref:Uncharacterized protein n=1 Tax=Maribacter ulvicola TaxID=228959 RepID=A0A1N6ZER3_9FLAO|nr:hypothetical protein [Maribacter ulvicola]SIR25288.1 hypothetical protein SAMN05421797_108158 [Maribacter ulvicola]
MNKITQAPHLVLWILIPVILLIGFLKPDKTLDINIYDTYLVIGLINLAVLISIIYGILGFGYWVAIRLNRKLVNWLTVIHLIFTVISFCFIILIPYFLPPSSQGISSLYFDAQTTLTLSAIVAVSIQSLYLINMITALFRKCKLNFL